MIIGRQLEIWNAESARLAYEAEAERQRNRRYRFDDDDLADEHQRLGIDGVRLRIGSSRRRCR